jgi:hypothetical protein
MDRRAFLSVLAGLLTAPLAAEAQAAGRLYKIGYLEGRTPFQCDRQWPRSGNPCKNWVGWMGATLPWRRAGRMGKADRLPVLAEELVVLGVDLIVTQASPPTRAAKQVTTTLPIIMWNTTDPVGQGFVASLASAGGTPPGRQTSLAS